MEDARIAATGARPSHCHAQSAMEFVCMCCRESVHVSFTRGGSGHVGCDAPPVDISGSSQAASNAPVTSTAVSSYPKGSIPVDKSMNGIGQEVLPLDASERHDLAPIPAQSGANGGQHESTSAQEAAARCARCDGYFHRNCSKAPAVVEVVGGTFLCARCQLGGGLDRRNAPESGALPILLPMQAATVLLDATHNPEGVDPDCIDPAASAGSNPDAPTHDWTVFTKQIEVCTSCRQVHFEPHERARCSQCATTSLHRVCVASNEDNRCPTCQPDASARRPDGVIASKRLALLIPQCDGGGEGEKEEEEKEERLGERTVSPEWWECCCDCQRRFCLHTLVDEEEEEEEEERKHQGDGARGLADRLGVYSADGWRCRRCSGLSLTMAKSASVADYIPETVSTATNAPDDRILLCDGCDGEFAMDQLSPPLEHVPTGLWFCPDCEYKGWLPAEPQKVEAVMAEEGGEKKPGLQTARTSTAVLAAPVTEVVTMLICDGCENEYELATVQPPLTQVPEGDWFCAQCQAATGGSSAIPAAPAASAGSRIVRVTLLICDACDGEFEMAALQPPLTEVPDGDWFCSTCVSQRSALSGSMETSTSVTTESLSDSKKAAKRRVRSRLSSKKGTKESRKRKRSSTTSTTLNIPVEEVSTGLLSGQPPALTQVVLLLCDGCDGEFDMAALDPPLASAPEGNWYCSACESRAVTTDMPRKKPTGQVCSSCAVPLLEPPAQRRNKSRSKKSRRKSSPLLVRPLCEVCDAQQRGELVEPSVPVAVPSNGSSSTSKKRRRSGSSPSPSPSPAQLIDAPIAVKNLKAPSSLGSVPSPRSPTTQSGRSVYRLPVAVTVQYPHGGDSGGSRSEKRTTGGGGGHSAKSLGLVLCSDDEGAGQSEEDDDRVVLVCEICLGEYKLADVMDVSEGDDEQQLVPPRPWYCLPCVRRLKKNRKKKLRVSKQMLLEMQLYGELLRPTAAKTVDSLTRALRGKKPVVEAELWASFELVGKRVGVLLSWDKHWVMGRVIHFDARSGQHLIRFDDDTERDLPLFALPVVVATTALLLVQVPEFRNEWWPAQVLTMNAIADKVVKDQADVDVEARHAGRQACRLVNLFTSGGDAGAPPNVVCWVPKYLCRAFPSRGSDGTGREAEPRLARRQQQRQQEERPRLDAMDDLAVAMTRARAEEETQQQAVWAALQRLIRTACGSVSMWQTLGDLLVGIRLTTCAKHSDHGDGVDKKVYEVVRFDAGTGLHTIASGATDSNSSVDTATASERSVDLRSVCEDGEITGVAKESGRALAKIQLTMHHHRMGTYRASSTSGGLDGEPELAARASVTTKKTPSQPQALCAACSLPAVVEGDADAEKTAASMTLVACVECSVTYHTYCCDPPHDAESPLMGVIGNGDHLLTTHESRFVCHKCVSCAGCTRKRYSSMGLTLDTSEEPQDDIVWYRWQQQLESVSVCSDCVDQYQAGEQCGVCARVLSNETLTRTRALLKCSTCALWVHPVCEPDTHPSFQKCSAEFENYNATMESGDGEFELDLETAVPVLKLDGEVSKEEDGKDEDDGDAGVSTGDGDGDGDGVASKSAREVDEACALALTFKKTYDPRVFHQYECWTCRRVRMLTLVSALQREDKLDLFKEPVTRAIAPTYFDVIKQPMDLSTMRGKVLSNEKAYRSVNFRELRDDFELMCLNAVTFNTRERDFMIWREAWRFYGQGQKLFRQLVPKSRMKQRGGRYFDALVLAAKRQLPNNSILGKKRQREQELLLLAQDDPLEVDYVGRVGTGARDDDDEQGDGEDGEDGEDELDRWDGAANNRDGGGHDRVDAADAGNSGPTRTTHKTSGKVVRDAADQDTGSLSSTARPFGGDSDGNRHDRVSVVSGVASKTTDSLEPSSGMAPPTTLMRKRPRESGVNGRAASSSTVMTTAMTAFAPQTVLGVVPKPHSVLTFYTMMQSRSAAHTYCWLDFCAVCGSAGALDELMFCVDCGEGFHAFCVQVSRDKLARNEALRSQWRCGNCTMCEVCGKPEHPPHATTSSALAAVGHEMLRCGHCERSYHGGCVVPVIIGGVDNAALTGVSSDAVFYCGRCVTCRECALPIPLSGYSYDRSLCLACSRAAHANEKLLRDKSQALTHVWQQDARRQRKAAERCPMCRLKWRVGEIALGVVREPVASGDGEGEDDVELIQCDACEGWAHPRCDPWLFEDVERVLTGEDETTVVTKRMNRYEWLVEDPTAAYICGACRPHGRAHLAKPRVLGHAGAGAGADTAEDVEADTETGLWKAQVRIAQIQHKRALCHARWQEARAGLVRTQRWARWKEHVAIYLYVLRLGEECVKALAYRSVNFHEEWASAHTTTAAFRSLQVGGGGQDHVTSNGTSSNSNGGMAPGAPLPLPPAWLLHKASRYLRFKRYARGPRAALRRQSRKNQNFYSQQGLEKVQTPGAIAVIASEAASCAALLVCVHLLYGWRPLQRVVLHLLQGSGNIGGDGGDGSGTEGPLSADLVNRIQISDDMTLEEEVAMIKRQYARRAGKRVGNESPTLRPSASAASPGSVTGHEQTESVSPHSGKASSEQKDVPLPQPEPLTVNGMSKSSPSILAPPAKPASPSVASRGLPMTVARPLAGWPVPRPAPQDSEHSEAGPTTATRTTGIVGVPSSSAVANVEPFEDSRHCALCFIVGDSPAVCGRLVYSDLDQWVHVNCALWSAEVFEDENHLLQRCQRAVSRGRTNRCDACGVLGATVGCCVARCQKHYHFPCAVDHGVLFFPTSETCCPLPKHIATMAKKLQIALPLPVVLPPTATATPLPRSNESVAIEAEEKQVVDPSVVYDGPLLEEEEGEAKADSSVSKMDGVADSSGGIEEQDCEPVIGEVSNESDDVVNPGAVASVPSGVDSIVPVPPPTASTEGTETAKTDAATPVLPVLQVLHEPRQPLRVEFASVMADAKKRLHALRAKRQVCFRIGALTVHSLGHIVIGNASFYARDAVFPLGFRSTRVYWSTQSVATRCLYECVVTSDDVEARERRRQRHRQRQASRLLSSSRLTRKSRSGGDAGGDESSEDERELEDGDHDDGSMVRALFKITASDDRAHPIVARSVSEALVELRSRVMALYEEHRSRERGDDGSSSGTIPGIGGNAMASHDAEEEDAVGDTEGNPFLRRTSWFSFGLLGAQFFGMGVPVIAAEIESLPHVATTAIRRRFVVERHRQRLGTSASGLTTSTSTRLPFGADGDVYVFAHRLPSASELAVALQEVEQVVEVEEHMRLSTGAMRTDGLPRLASEDDDHEDKKAAGSQTQRRRLNKDVGRELELLPYEKAHGQVAGGSSDGSNGSSNGIAGNGGENTTVDANANANPSTTTTTTTNTTTTTTIPTMDLEHLPIAMQYRELRRRPFDERLEVRKSRIHGYGLFTKEAMAEGQMIVEYQGQMIDQQVADAREKRYEEQGIGSCYMFRLDAQTIIDATRCGNLARFMNHSCDPKAFARVVSVENNDKKIVIFAKRALEAGEEVTYDYKFPIEDEAIRCDCGAPLCVGRMN